jgi:XTP/dITP diphosphohydrolase
MSDVPNRLVVATGNAKKLKELDAIVRRLVPGDRVTLVTTASLGLESPEEDGDTFSDNARIKARAAFVATGLPTLADDSGLSVDALGGAPGVFSARYAGEGAGDAANNRKLIAALAGVPEAARGASFRCAIALFAPAVFLPRLPGATLDPATGAAVVVTEGRVDGRIVDTPGGAGGFGYDPHFLYPPAGRTFAELDAAEKHAISHRGRALAALSPALAALFSP